MEILLIRKKLLLLGLIFLLGCAALPNRQSDYGIGIYTASIFYNVANRETNSNADLNNDGDRSTFSNSPTCFSDRIPNRYGIQYVAKCTGRRRISAI